MEKQQWSSILLGVVFLALMGLVSSAVADTITVIRDGREYSCESGNPNPGGALDCVTKAYAGPFSRDEATRLCGGSRSEAPALCGAAAYRGQFSKEESIDLCIRATSESGPSDCAQTLYRGPFSKEQSIRACRRDGDTARAECVMRAYHGPYSKEEAIKICAGDSLLVLRSLKLIETSPTLMERVRHFKSSFNFDAITGQ